MVPVRYLGHTHSSIRSYEVRLFRSVPLPSLLQPITDNSLQHFSFAARVDGRFYGCSDFV